MTGVPEDDEINIAFSDYSNALGRVAYSWNRLHERLGELFSIVIGPPVSIGAAIWHSLANDRVQRTIFKAAIEAVPAEQWAKVRPTAKDDLIWVIEEINGLAHHRDDAIHAPVDLILKNDEAVIATVRSSQHKRAKNLLGKELIVEFDYYARRADAYWEYIMQMMTGLLYGHFPWPNRPSLPNRRPKTALLNLRRPPPAK